MRYFIRLPRNFVVLHNDVHIFDLTQLIDGVTDAVSAALGTLQDLRGDGDYNDFVDMSYDIAKYHHEKWDGSGYPEGIAGDAIPLPAQIVGLVSTYCALTENRSYRKAFSKEEALEFMEVAAGVDFNADIFNIYKKIARQLR